MTAADYLKRGNKHYEDQQFQKALSDYNKAINLNPENALTYKRRGILFINLGRKEEALLDYDKAIDLEPEDVEAYNNRGLLFKDLRRNKEALSDYNKAIDLDSEYGSAYSNRGFLFEDLGRKEEALSDYNKAIDLNSEYFGTYINRGILYNVLGRKEEALSDYNKAIDLDSENAHAYNNRGNLLYELGRKEEALLDFIKAIDLRPVFAAPLNGVGNVYLNEMNLMESQRSQKAQRYFLRALVLEIHPNIIRSYLHTYRSYPKHPFFLQRLFSLLAHKIQVGIGIQEQVANTCRYVNLYLTHLKLKVDTQQVAKIQWNQIIALINYFMGDPAMAFQMLKQILLANPYNLQAHYYLINSCYDFLEKEEPYLETALDIAEQVYQTLQLDKRQTVNEFFINQRYYAALIFKLDTEYQMAIDCIEDIWDRVDYLPIGYLYYLLLFELQKEQIETERRQSALDQLKENQSQDTADEYEEEKEAVLYDDYWTEEDNLDILEKNPFSSIAITILNKEKEEDRDKYFAYGFPIHFIDPNREKWWEPFYHYAHYKEVSDAISLFQLQVANHHKGETIEVVPGHSLPDFWDCFQIKETDIIEMKSTILQKERERYGQLFLQSAKAQLKQVADPITRNKENLRKAIYDVLYEGRNRNLQVKSVFENFEKRLDRTPNALMNDIIDHIEAHELNGDVATYHYLISYFYLCKDLSEQDCIMLQLYAIYAQAFQKKELSKIIQGGFKDQFKDIFGSGYDLATTAVTAANPVAGLAMSALKPLAKGSMGELFVNLIKNRSHTTMMRYSEPTHDAAPYDKMLLAPSFKAAFVEFVGEEKERLGSKFDSVYPLYEFEEWFE